MCRGWGAGHQVLIPSPAQKPSPGSLERRMLAAACEAWPAHIDKAGVRAPGRGRGPAVPFGVGGGRVGFRVDVRVVSSSSLMCEELFAGTWGWDVCFGV